MNNLGFIIKISRNQLLSRLRQSLVAALGVAFGIGSYIILMSFMTGLNDLLDGLVLNRSPHVRIYKELNISDNQPSELYDPFHVNWNVIHSIKPRNTALKIHNALNIMNYLKTQKEVISVTAQTDVQVFYGAGATDLNGLVTGIIPKEEVDFYFFEDYITDGKAMDLTRIDNGIILGAGLAQKLSKTVGDRIQIKTSNGSLFYFKIVGIFQSGLSDIDNAQSYVVLEMAQMMLGQGKDYISNIHIKLKNKEKSPYYSNIWGKKFESDAIDIFRANAQFDTGSSMRTMISYAVAITLLIVAGFGIYNILNMMIYEKMDEIAILKATGFSGRDVQMIFLSQAIFIGFVGAIIGLIIGYLVSVWISVTPYDTEALPTVDTFPVRFDWRYYVIGTIFALISTFLAGFLPSLKAKSIDPVDIIRGK